MRLFPESEVPVVIAVYSEGLANHPRRCIALGKSDKAGRSANCDGSNRGRISTGICNLLIMEDPITEGSITSRPESPQGPLNEAHIAGVVLIGCAQIGGIVGPLSKELFLKEPKVLEV